MSVAPWILLFAKAPIPGTVKTRLAATVGALEALRIYRFLAERQMDAIREAGLPCVVWTTPEGSEGSVTEWLIGASEVRLQPQGDLGERMSYACDQAFACGAPGVVLVGTDCPDLDATRIAALVDRVGQGAFVLQPALDGGYVAFGLPRPCPSVFQGVAWSTGQVLAETVLRLRSVGAVPELLEPLSDIDTLDDWTRWTARERPLLDGGRGLHSLAGRT